MAALDQLMGLANVIGAFSDKESKTTTSGTKTSTTQTNISDAGVQKLVEQILAGSGGVKSIGGAARRSGLYNSTTEENMLSELYSDAAVKAELARSPTTTSESASSTSATAQEGAGLGTLGAVLGGGMLLNQLFKGASGSSGGGIGSLISGLFSGGAGAAAGATGADIGALSSIIGPEAVKMLGGAGGASTAAAGSALAPGFGSFFSGLLGGKEASTDPLSLLSSAGAGFMAGGPLGALIAPLAAVGGGFLGDASVICTALNKQGLISQHLHAAGHKYLVSLDPTTRLGYYLWAERIAKKIDGGSKFWKWAMLVPTWSYLVLVASDRGILDHLENPIGALVRLVGEPICHFIGATHLQAKLLRN